MSTLFGFCLLAFFTSVTAGILVLLNNVTIKDWKSYWKIAQTSETVETALFQKKYITSKISFILFQLLCIRSLPPSRFNIIVTFPIFWSRPLVDCRYVLDCVVCRVPPGPHLPTKVKIVPYEFRWIYDLQKNKQNACASVQIRFGFKSGITSFICFELKLRHVAPIVSYSRWKWRRYIFRLRNYNAVCITRVQSMLTLEVESRTQGSRPRTRPRTQKKSEAKAKDSLFEERHSRGQGQECSRPRPRTKDTSASALRKKGFHKNFSGDLHKKTFSKKFFKRSTNF